MEEGGADAGIDLPDEGPGNGGGGNSVGYCEEQRPVSTLSGPHPDLHLVVDRSASMAEPLSGGADKWTELTSAVSGVVVSQHARMNLGLSLFPGNIDGCAAGNVTTHIDDKSWQDIARNLYDAEPGGGAPVHTTMRLTQLYLETLPPNPDGRFVLLATDGSPTCKSKFDPESESLTESIDAITAMREIGIPTYVLGVGNADVEALDQMAAAGGTEKAFRADSAASLTSALNELTLSLSAPECWVSLSKAPEDVEQMVVYFDRVEVPADGWVYDAEQKRIDFVGAACDEIQSGSVRDIVVYRGCEEPDID